MDSYTALLRGIGPGNPNMRSEKLKGAFEAVGFKEVQTLLSSGNLVFKASEIDKVNLENKIQLAIFKNLGFKTTAFVLSKAEIKGLIEDNPFKGLTHENSGKTYLTVTYLKDWPKDLPKFPYKPEGKPFSLIAFVNGALCSVVNLNEGKTPDLMAWLERQYGKQITTRTWLTMNRINIKLIAM